MVPSKFQLRIPSLVYEEANILYEKVYLLSLYKVNIIIYKYPDECSQR